MAASAGAPWLSGTYFRGKDSSPFDAGIAGCSLGNESCLSLAGGPEWPTSHDGSANWTPAEAEACAEALGPATERLMARRGKAVKAPRGEFFGLQRCRGDHSLVTLMKSNVCYKVRNGSMHVVLGVHRLVE